jgi:ribosomal protein L17
MKEVFYIIAIVFMIFMADRINKVIRVIETQNALQLRIESTEREVKELRQCVNTLGTIAERNLIDAKDLFAEIKHGVKNESTSEKRIEKPNRNKNRKGPPQVH